jgi:ribose 5-phosphate isomerase B
MTPVYIASDHGGVLLKEAVVGHLRGRFAVTDMGPATAESCDYPLFAKELCRTVLNDAGSLGILICGSGIGMSMAANRFAGIRAALCTTELAARLSRQHNDANVLCLGERLIGPALALAIVDAFFDAEFEAGRHARRVDLIELATD